MAAKAKKKSAARNGKRSLAVFGGLVGALAGTSVLLLVLAPAPLRPDGASSMGASALAATQEVGSGGGLFATSAEVVPGRWKYIYVHQSKTAWGNGMKLGERSGSRDHFVIGNGNGCPDGEIEATGRWDKQLGALPPVGASEIDPGCISICVVGDFDRTVPTPTQLKRLGELIGALRSRLDLPGDRVMFLEKQVGSPGIGRYFPVTSLRGEVGGEQG